MRTKERIQLQVKAKRNGTSGNNRCKKQSSEGRATSIFKAQWEPLAPLPNPYRKAAKRQNVPSLSSQKSTKSTTFVTFARQRRDAAGIRKRSSSLWVSHFEIFNTLMTDLNSLYIVIVSACSSIPFNLSILS
mmetsp:Transcript_3525/g.5262  ORF Transcript_3525/g.5262 Transcript_3525/m.5262 type:complete len:132 (+) Transcript_3525:141-536(+)